MSPHPPALTAERRAVTHEVLADLVDAAVAEGLVDVEPPAVPGDRGRVGALPVRLRPGGRLQRWRAVPGGVGPDDGSVAFAAVVDALGLGGPGTAAVAADLAASAEHGAAVRAGLADVDHAPRTAGLLAGERWAATRGRPFHPTARAVSGWTAADVAAYGPMRAEPLACRWVAVARDHLRSGTGPGSAALADAVLPDPADRSTLDAALARAGVTDTHRALPVHPWQAEHVLPDLFAAELAAGTVVGLDVLVGRLWPTASFRTLAVADAPGVHLKLPVGVATLGATRLLPPRYLDNGERAERVVRTLLARDPALAALVDLCDETTWLGWSAGDDEFDDRPGHLAAQIRRYPAPPADAVELPMGALAADGWHELGPALGVTDPRAFFAGLAEAFAGLLLGFLDHGVLPEVHGQNVVVRVGEHGTVRGFVLRDHDTLRIAPAWMAAAGVAEPDYRIRPGGRQSLRLDDPEDLVGYAQTLGLQVNLYAVADALGRHHGLDDAVFWDLLAGALRRALAARRPRPAVADAVERLVLRAPRWPTRTLLGPLLAQGRSGSVSMPAGTGWAPNPLLAPGDGR